MVAGLAAIVFGALAIEARRAASNERTQFARGGIEPPDDVYRWMRIVYPASFAAMLAEGALRAASPSQLPIAGAVIFAAAKALKWWAIVSLGCCWTFRVVVVPHATLVAGGPYRFLRHPNYIAVVGELAGVALLTRARVSGPITIVIFAMLLARRIRVEERALATARGVPPAS